MGVLAIAPWLASFSGFAADVNRFSETGRSGGGLVLALAQLAFVAALVTTGTQVVRLALGAPEGSRR